jgi:hypothetical protein
MPLCEELIGEQLWAITVPAIAFECQYVYSAILGISALHLLSLNPDDISLKTSTYQYIDETIASHRQAITHIDSHNSLPLFTAALLLTIHTTIRPHCLSSDITSYTLPLQQFYLQEGIAQLYHQTKEHIIDTDVQAFIDARPAENETPINYFSPSQEGFTADHLLDIWRTKLSIPLERVSVYAAAFDLLALIKMSINQGEKAHWVQRKLSTVPGKLPKEFVSYLEQNDPLAMAIMARFFALSKFVDGVWRLRGMAGYEVTGIASLMPEEWMWSMDWPLGLLDDDSSITLEEMLHDR